VTTQSLPPASTEKKILDAALKMFVEKGFSASTESITKEAGVSTGILFHYYKTKNDLIIALYADFYLEYLQGTRQLRKAIDTVEPEKFAEIHRQAFFEGVNWCLDNWDKFQYIQLVEGSLLLNKFRLEDDVRFKEMFAAIMEVLQMGVERGIFKSLPPEFIMSNIYAITNSVAKYLHENEKYRRDSDFMEQSWKIYWEAAAK
jgi:AcrR family transcriptional regulator